MTAVTGVLRRAASALLVAAAGLGARVLHLDWDEEEP